MSRGLKITLIIAVAQMLTTFVVFWVALGFYTEIAAKSVVIGGLISIAGTVLFGLRTFAGGSFQPAEKMLIALYTGEALKIVLTVFLFIAAIKWMGAAFLPMMIAYGIALMVFWLVLPFRLT